jgi:3-oxoacyl-[acyl-carrier protein] reductase
MNSDNRVVLVTGGARGIGRLLSERCAQAGWSVAINYFSSSAAAETLAADLRHSGMNAVALQGDVSRADDAARVVEGVVQALGGLHAVINNAGVAEVRTFDQADEAHFERMMSVNVKSAYLVSQAAVRQMIVQGSGGRLIFMSSLAAATGGVISPAYAASKAALAGLMHYYATYLLPHKITANALAPALIESDMVHAMRLPPPEALPLGRLGRPEEIWPTIRMMLEVEYMTGQTIHLNAGRYMT